MLWDIPNTKKVNIITLFVTDSMVSIRVLFSLILFFLSKIFFLILFFFRGTIFDWKMKTKKRLQAFGNFFSQGTKVTTLRETPYSWWVYHTKVNAIPE